LLAAAAWWAWWVYTLPPTQRSDASVFGAFVLTLAGVVISLAIRLLKKKPGGVPRRLDDVADKLSKSVKYQWDSAAQQRGLLPQPIPVQWGPSKLRVAGPIAGALTDPDVPARFAPLPGLRTITEAQLTAGGGKHELYELYGGLPSGRLIIEGAPGSGKSGAAVLLLLDALSHREQVRDRRDKAGVPVPVLFTLHGWNPNTQKLEDWLTGLLIQTYPELFEGRHGKAEAHALVADDARVTVILDGLDEVAERLRPIILRALNEQARFRFVLLTRSDELVRTAGRTHLLGAVALELQDIDGQTAADYLIRRQLDPPPKSWQQLIEHLRHHPGSPLTAALHTPLRLREEITSSRYGVSRGSRV
jgi:hypothetical protein